MLLLNETAVSQMEWYSKLVAIDNLWGTGGAAFIVMILTNVCARKIKHENRLQLSFFFALMIAGALVYLANIQGWVLRGLITVVNAAIITGVAYAANDFSRIAFEVKDAPKTKRGKKMGATTEEIKEEQPDEKGFFKSWI